MIIKPDLNKTCYILLVKIKRYLKYKYRFDGFTLFKKKEKNERPNIFVYLTETVCRKW